ncbi:MAG: ABC transporter permease [Deltaproteobacteria bacterium]|nr:ABC transporter permease [Deltaproteobacteria bacterium]
MNFLRIRELVRKEFIQLFRDKKNRPILVIAPLVQLLVFGYVVSTDVRTISVGIVDESRTPESRKLVDAFNGNATFNVVFADTDSRRLERELLHRRLDLALKIPPDFAELIKRRETASVQILVDGSMSNMASVRIAYASFVLDRFNRDLIAELHPFTLEYGTVDGRFRTWYNPNLYSQNYFVPGIVAFLIMLLTLLFTSMAIIKEKEAGTMEQLMVTPLKSWELIAGKTIPYIIIAMSQMIVVTIFAVFWFRIPFAGSILLLFFSTCLFLLSTLGMGLFISTIAATQQQAMMTTFFVILPVFMLSGFVFPIANMPQFVQWITLLNPLRYFLVIIRGIFLKGVGFYVLWNQLFALTVIGIIVFAGSVMRFRKRLD